MQQNPLLGIDLQQVSIASLIIALGLLVDDPVVAGDAIKRGLAAHGGPLWEPLCYAQIGGLTAATFFTLLLVPVFYAICVLDLKIVKWDRATSGIQ